MGLTNALTKADAVFSYVFGSSTNSVQFTHSCLAWSVLYNRLIEGAGTRSAVRETIDGINKLVKGDFVYRRWEEGRYLKYPAPKPKPKRTPRKL